MVLVNGSSGIGTGWSTDVPTYNPRDIIANLRLMISGEQPNMLVPWFRGFVGSIEEKTGKDSGNYTVSGIAEMVAEDRVVISELPIGKWTSDYKQMLETMLIGNTAVPEKKVFPWTT
jgi:DNA topoisomerase-2